MANEIEKKVQDWDLGLEDFIREYKNVLFSTPFDLVLKKEKEKEEQGTVGVC